MLAQVEAQGGKAVLAAEVRAIRAVLLVTIIHSTLYQVDHIPKYLVILELKLWQEPVSLEKQCLTMA